MDVVAKFFASHPQGFHPSAKPQGELIKRCRQFLDTTAEAGDVIMAVDGIRTSELTPSQLLDIFTTCKPGAMVKLQVLTERQGVQGSLNVRQLYNSLPNHRHGYSVCLHVAHKPESHS